MAGSIGQCAYHSHCLSRKLSKYPSLLYGLGEYSKSNDANLIRCLGSRCSEINQMISFLRPWAQLQVWQCCCGDQRHKRAKDPPLNGHHKAHPWGDNETSDSWPWPGASVWAQEVGGGGWRQDWQQDHHLSEQLRIRHNLCCFSTYYFERGKHFDQSIFVRHWNIT